MVLSEILIFQLFRWVLYKQKLIWVEHRWPPIPFAGPVHRQVGTRTYGPGVEQR